jgi:hypothetical protein
MSAGEQTKLQAGPAQSFTPTGTGLLQSKCTLCNTPGLVKDSERDDEGLTLQRSPVDQAEPSVVLPIVHEVLRSPGKPLDPEMRAFMEPRFGHDFSRVSVLRDAPAMIQAKLTISQPNDRYEQEADRVADEVMRMPEPKVQQQPIEEEENLQAKSLAEQITPLVQRLSIIEEEEHQVKELPGQTSEVTQNLESRIEAIKDSGQPLPDPIRSFFEPRFGADFGKVRIYRDKRAANIAQSIDARAFTLGLDMIFGVGQYSPGTNSGRKLLAHELIHVIQQNGGQSQTETGSAPIPHSLQQVNARAQPGVSVSSLVADGTIQRTASVRRRRRVDNRPDIIRFEMDRPANRDALLAQIRTDLIAALHRVVRPPILARIGDLSEDLSSLLDLTESQGHIVFELSVAWSSSTTVDHVSLLSQRERVLRNLEDFPPMQWEPAGEPGDCATSFCNWVMGDEETRAPALTSAFNLNCWEAILLAAYHAHVVLWQWLHNLYVLHSESGGDVAFANMLSRDQRIVYSPPHRVPARGDIVFFWSGNNLSHVGLATGGLNPRGLSPEVIGFMGRNRNFGPNPPVTARVEEPAVRLYGNVPQRIEYAVPQWGW